MSFCYQAVLVASFRCLLLADSAESFSFAAFYCNSGTALQFSFVIFIAWAAAFYFVFECLMFLH